MRDSFIFYRSFFEAVDEADEPTQLVVYRAIANYALNYEEPELSGMASIVWKLIKPQLDANWRRFTNGCKGGEYGVRGGAPKGNSNATKQPQNNPKTTPKQPQNNPSGIEKTTPNVNDNVNVNVNDNDNGNNKVVSRKSCRFVVPTLADIQEYITQNHYNVDAQKFLDYYTANGWMIGKAKVKDWRACIRTWQRNERTGRSSAASLTLQDNSKEKYDDDSLKW